MVSPSEHNSEPFFFFCRKLHFERVKFYPDNALGQKFGSCFQVEKEQLKLVDGSASRQDSDYVPSNGEPPLPLSLS